MPFYDYKCPSCETVQEVFHSMSSTPDVLCDKCNLSMKRVYYPTTFSLPATKERQVISARLKQEGEQRHELLENYGIAKVVPLDGQSVGDVYKEVKTNSGQVKEKMKREDEKRIKKEAIRARESKRLAIKNSEKMWVKQQEEKAKKAAKARAIKL